MPPVEGTVRDGKDGNSECESRDSRADSEGSAGKALRDASVCKAGKTSQRVTWEERAPAVISQMAVLRSCVTKRPAAGLRRARDFLCLRMGRGC